MKPTDLVDQPNLRDDVPDFAPGDTLKVHVRVVEGTRERVQIFQGAVIRRQGGGIAETFTVRKVSFGVGVERTFPVHSPVISKIERVSPRRRASGEAVLPPRSRREVGQDQGDCGTDPAAGSPLVRRARQPCPAPAASSPDRVDRRPRRVDELGEHAMSRHLRLGADGEAVAAHHYAPRRVRDRRPQLAMPRRASSTWWPDAGRSWWSARSRPARSERFGGGAAAVGVTRQRRLRHAAARFLETQPWAAEVRFDVAVVRPGAHGFAIEVIEAAF